MISVPQSPLASLTLLLMALLAISACQTAVPAGLTAEQVALLKQEGFVLVDDDWELNLSGKFLFGIDEDRLGEESSDTVRKLARALLDVGIDSVRLDGHTDTTGRSDYNQQLSLRRAATVAEEMINSGMQSSLVEIRGLGDSKPISLENTDEGRRENRRVVVVVSSR
ncbi:MAG: OmpA family protein [Porticoccaceae bacterium]|jgi:outer membrane protein OmpA-like peptidoglycan-associated protein